MIKKFLKGNIIDIAKPAVIKSVSVRGKKVKLLKCPYCAKTSYSSPGLKRHITRMHKLKDKKSSDISIDENNMKMKDHIFEEAKKVAHLLLEELIDLTDDQEQSINEIEEVTLDEKSDEMDENSANKY